MGLLEFLPGAIQATTIIAVGFPFDTVKTRMQAGPYVSSIHCFHMTVRNEGVRALYRGVSAPLALHVVKRSYQYYMFEELVKNHNSYLAGMVTGACGTLLGNPMHVIKTNTQVSDSKKYKHAWDFVQQHWAKHRLPGFYKGLGINLIKDMMFGSLYLGTYGEIRKQLPNKPHYNFVTGGIASIVSWSILLPIDCLKTMIQTHPEKITIRQAVKSVPTVWHLWRGFWPTMIRVFPVSGAGMMAYECTRKFID